MYTVDLTAFCLLQRESLLNSLSLVESEPILTWVLSKPQFGFYSDLSFQNLISGKNFASSQALINCFRFFDTVRHFNYFPSTGYRKDKILNYQNTLFNCVMQFNNYSQLSLTSVNSTSENLPSTDPEALVAAITAIPPAITALGSTPYTQSNFK